MNCEFGLAAASIVRSAAINTTANLRFCLLAAAIALSGCATAPLAGSPVDEGPTPNGSTAPVVSFFVVAHADDWQLFMNPAAFRSLDQPNERAVFVHLTAGDAGLGSGGTPVPYYRAREEGALRAIRFMVNAVANGAGGVEMQRESVDRGGLLVERVVYANTTTYFLRLPDGNGPADGGGYSTTGYQSLAGLFAERNPSIQSVDGIATYQGWASLVDTLESIYLAEAQVGEARVVHVTERDPALNPREHSDHRHAAMAAEEAAAPSCMVVFRHDTYSTRTRPENVFGTALAIDLGTWAATASGLSDGHAASTWEPVHNSWLGRSFARQAELTEGCRSEK